MGALAEAGRVLVGVEFELDEQSLLQVAQGLRAAAVVDDVQSDAAGEAGAEEEAALEAEVGAAEGAATAHDTEVHPLGKDDFFVGQQSEDLAGGEIETGFEGDLGFEGAAGGIFEAGDKAAEAQAEPIAAAHDDLGGIERGDAEPA